MTWDWRGLTATILAVGLVITICALAIGTASSDRPVSVEESTLLSTAIGAVIGALGAFLGFHASGTGHLPSRTDQMPPPGDESSAGD